MKWRFPIYDDDLTNHMWGFQLPRRARHGIYGVCATDADRKQAKSSSIWGMRVYGLALMSLSRLDVR